MVKMVLIMIVKVMMMSMLAMPMTINMMIPDDDAVMV